MDLTQNEDVVEEVCSSCESGWTDYFLSPPNSTDDDMADYNNSGEGRQRGKDIPNTQKGSDNDSLASDASSGPSHRKRPGKSSRAPRCANPKGGEESSSSSGWSCKMGFSRGKKERSVEKKGDSRREAAIANTSAFHGRHEARRKK